MAFILKSMFSYYNYIYSLKGLFELIWAFNFLPHLSFTDPRSASFILIQDSPLLVLSILSAYSLICKFGPLLMKSKQPFELRGLMIFYNIVQASSCAYFATKVSFGIHVNLNISPKKYQWKNFSQQRWVNLQIISGSSHITLEIWIQFLVSTCRLQRFRAWNGWSYLMLHLFASKNFGPVWHGMISKASRPKPSL